MKAVFDCGSEGVKGFWEFTPTDFCNFRSAVFSRFDFGAKAGVLATIS